MWSQRLIVDPR